MQWIRNPAQNGVLNKLVGLFHRTHRITKNLRQRAHDHEETAPWARRAIEVLARKLSRCPGALTELKQAIMHPETPSACVLLPRNGLDECIQVMHYAAAAHAICCKLWRWPDLQSHFELRSLTCCKNPLSRGYSENICINPFHYERVEWTPDMPAILVPRLEDPAFPNYQKPEMPRLYDMNNAGYCRPGNYNLDPSSVDIEPPFPSASPDIDDILKAITGSPAYQTSEENSSNSLTSSGVSSDFRESDEEIGTSIVQQQQHQGQLPVQLQRQQQQENLQQEQQQQLQQQLEQQQLQQAQLQQQRELRQLQQQQMKHQLEQLQQQQRLLEQQLRQQQKEQALQQQQEQALQQQQQQLHQQQLMMQQRQQQQLPQGQSQQMQPNQQQQVQQQLLPPGLPPLNQIEPVPSTFYTRVEYEEPEIWAKISYYEFNSRVGEMFHCKRQVVVVDGFMNPDPDSHRFSIGRFTNTNRTSASERTRRSIGAGIQFHRANGRVMLQNNSPVSIYVQSRCANVNLGINPITVVKVPSGAIIKVFDNELYSNIVRNSIRYGFETVYHLTQYCTIRLSFVKGWGTEYQCQDITHTPCWIEANLAAPMQWLDKILAGLGSAQFACSSVS